MDQLRKLVTRLVVKPGSRVSLKKHDPAWTGALDGERDAAQLLEEGVRSLTKWQDRLYAQDTHSLLIIFQAMDAAGKDSTIRHVMSGVNPQGCQVFSFKVPSAEERDHTYLWRSFKALPERGRIGIHNRSYYEEVLVPRVHKDILRGAQLPTLVKTDPKIWKKRFSHINGFERYLVENGTHVLKFFLHVSKDEQKRRLLARIDDPDKNWKFSAGDVALRQHWDAYMKAYEDLLTQTSTKWAPWHVIPADHKWFMRVAVAEIINSTLESLKLRYPAVTEEKTAELKAARRQLIREK